MHDLIEAIKAWPVIIQGALGSGVFWLVLLIGQWVTSYASKKYSYMSKQSRKSYLISARAKYTGHISKDSNVKFQIGTFLLFRASRPAMRSFMWLIQGLILNLVIEPAGIVGYFASLYYLFKAYDIVRPIEDDEDAEAALKKIKDELAELENNP